MRLTALPVPHNITQQYISILDSKLSQVYYDNNFFLSTVSLAGSTVQLEKEVQITSYTQAVADMHYKISEISLEY